MKAPSEDNCQSGIMKDHHMKDKYDLYIYSSIWSTTKEISVIYPRQQVDIRKKQNWPSFHPVTPSKKSEETIVLNIETESKENQ